MLRAWTVTSAAGRIAIGAGMMLAPATATVFGGLWAAFSTHERAISTHRFKS